MIIKLGLKPTYTAINKYNNEVYYNTSSINYMSNLPLLLNMDIKHEQEAITQYQKIIKDANSEIITNILNRIILDEEQHIKIFKSILTNLI